MNRKALGRGLGALLSSDRTIDLAPEPSEVDVDSIVPGPMQPRTSFDETSLESLADSIRAHGIVQPLLVRRRGDGYELVAGERRRSEEHTSELQSPCNLVCRLLLEKKKGSRCLTRSVI